MDTRVDVQKTDKENRGIIRHAFRKALELEKGPFNLKGRGHEPRVTFNPKTAATLRKLELPRVFISGFGPNYHYPLRLVMRAAQLCGVPASTFTRYHIPDRDIERLRNLSGPAAANPDTPAPADPESKDFS